MDKKKYYGCYMSCASDKNFYPMSSTVGASDTEYISLLEECVPDSTVYHIDKLANEGYEIFITEDGDIYKIILQESSGFGWN